MNMNNDSALDKVVGLIAVVMNLCCGVLVGLFATGALLVGTFSGALPGFLVGGFVGLIGILIGASALLGIAAGVGIFQSMRWGFTLGLVVFGLATLLHLLGGGNVGGIIVEGALAVYCYLRLAGKTGPPVKN